MLFEVRCPGCKALGWCPCAVCIDGLEPPTEAVVAGAASVAMLFSHEGIGREFIHALKYRGERAISKWLAESLARCHQAVASGPIDVVTWAPTTASHRRSRGFDQAETLARATARFGGVRAARLLRRVGNLSQSHAGREARLAGPSFVASPRAAGLRVLVIDDVMTTGATMRSATAALLGSRAAQVHVAVCARRGGGEHLAAA